MTQKNPEIKSKNPLVTVVKEKNYYVLYEGFHRRAVLFPQYFENFCKIKSVNVEIDGVKKEIKIPSIVKVKNYFKVLSNKRVNVIGYSSKKNEANVKIIKKDVAKRYSVDKKGNIYRVEIYDKKSFCGMLLVDFGG